jgi:hypothetical protein
MIHSPCAGHIAQNSVQHSQIEVPQFKEKAKILESLPAKVNNSAASRRASFGGRIPSAQPQRFFCNSDILRVFIKRPAAYISFFSPALPLQPIELSSFALVIEPIHAYTLALETPRCSLPFVTLLLLQVFYFYRSISVNAEALQMPPVWRRILRSLESNLFSLTLNSPNASFLYLASLFTVPGHDYLKAGGTELQRFVEDCARGDVGFKIPGIFTFANGPRFFFSNLRPSNSVLPSSTSPSATDIPSDSMPANLENWPAMLDSEQDALENLVKSFSANIPCVFLLLILFLCQDHQHVEEAETDKRAWFADDATTRRLMLQSEKEYALSEHALNEDLQRTDDTLKAIGLRRKKVGADGVCLNICCLNV